MFVKQLQRKAHSVRALALVALLVAVAIHEPGDATSVGDFNPEPELPYESTSLEQDDWFETARRLQGDGVEAAQLAACDYLIGDATTPHELVRWATLRKVELLTYTKREREAVAVARAWLKEYPDDPGALAIRSVVAETMAQRMHAGFRPGLIEVSEAFQDLFEHHDPHEWDVIEAHVIFARRLGPPFYDHRTGRLVPARRTEELETAKRLILERNQDPDMPDIERQRGLRYIETVVEPMLHPRGAREPTEEERLERRKRSRDRMEKEFCEQGKDPELVKQFLDALYHSTKE